MGKQPLPVDAWNTFSAINLNLAVENWAAIKPALSYAEYMRQVQFPNDPEFAEAVIAASNQKSLDRVARYDDTVARINVLIGKGIKSKKQAEALQTLLQEMREIIFK